MLRASVMILRHLEDRISGLSIPQPVKQDYLDHLAAAKQSIENWKVEDTIGQMKVIREMVQNDLTGAVMARTDAEPLIELSDRVLELLE